MPNYIKNKIEFICDDETMKTIFDRYNTHHPETERRTYDGKIICMTKDSEVGWLDEKTNTFSRRDKEDIIGKPEDFYPFIENAYDQFPDFNKIIPQPSNIFSGNLSGEDEERCKAEGRPTWYDWNRANWGTKWNSFECTKLSDRIFTFETAWSGVPKLIEKISCDFPEIKIIYTYADENTSHNCGRQIYKDGYAIEDYSPDGGSKEAYELAFELRPDRKEDYILVDGEYIYKDEE